jgi:aspartyl-tRNA(Asn)/glutamyl-tRNA(Gln) amidotransferase subunit A
MSVAEVRSRSAPADPALMSLAQAAQAIRARRLSSVEATRAALARIERWQPRLNCFIALDADGALKQAAALDAELARGRIRGALHGVPLAHKDMFYRAGRISTCGSEIRRHWRATATATVLERLDAAGAVDLGTLNMSEFAAGPTGHNEHFGHCRNPFNPAHVTGGSSSGSGAAVAARLVYGALGSDTGGSIRLPAAANGVVGLKPTYGRVSRHGALARAWSLDHVGPLTRTAEDSALMMAAIAGHDPNDGAISHEPVPDFSAGLADGIKGLRVGVVDDADGAPVDDEVRGALAASLDVLRSLGAQTVPVRLTHLKLWYDFAETIAKCEGASVHARWLRERPQDYSAHVRTRIEAGLVLPATRYLEALAQRGRHLAEFLDTAMAGVDVLHCPAIPIPVPTIAETDLEGTGEAVLALVGRITTFTRPFNFLGLPVISVPCGFTRNGLPVAFQVAAKPFAEPLLLRVAASYQAATDFHERVPELP